MNSARIKLTIVSLNESWFLPARGFEGTVDWQK
jgi:hypothetical protein